MSSPREMTDGRAPSAPADVADLQDEVARLRARLERERRARVEAEQITETATARLYEVNQDLEAFVANAAHDLRTPVIAIQGFADLLSRSLESEDADAVAVALDRIEVNASFLGEVLNDLLALAAAARERVPEETLDPDVIVASVVADLEQRYPEGRVHAGSVPPLGIGGGDLRRILTNLLGNALAYGGDEVRVDLDARSDGEDVILTVSDDGVGIPVADRDRIFEPFVRGAGHDRSSGTGLGLSISRRICRQVGGDLRLLPSRRGATFQVTLPAPS